MTPHGHFHWNELRTRDAERAKRFYTRHHRLDISIHHCGRRIDLLDRIIWAISPSQVCSRSTSHALKACRRAGFRFWRSTTLTRRVKHAVAAGAELMIPIFDVPNVGRIAMLREPSGAGIGWMTPSLLSTPIRERLA